MISGYEERLSSISVPLCSSFKPTILEGQLCYQLQLNDTSGQGKANELMLLLDYQQDLSLNYSSATVESLLSILASSMFETVSTVDFSPDENINEREVKIQIGTLSPFKGFGVGTCKMTAVKRMTAKSDFLKMSLDDRKCEVELYEDCRTQKLFGHCKCVPWEMSSFQV